MNKIFVFLSFLAVFGYSQVSIKTYYDDGKYLLNEFYHVNNKRDKILNGHYERYFPNGNLEMLGKYTNGKKDSIFVEYWFNKNLKSVFEYKKGKKMVAF